MKKTIKNAPFQIWCFCLAVTLVLSLSLLGLAGGKNHIAQGNSLSTAIEDSKEDNKESPKKIALPIVMYHSIFDKNVGKYVLSPSQLEKDLEYIVKNGYTTIFASDLINYVENGVCLPDKPIMLTFDDGAKTKYLYAYPLLKKHNLRAVFFVVGKWTDDEETKKGSSLTYEMIDTMHKSGLIEIQHHSYDMHKDKGRIGMSQKKGESDIEYKEALRQDLTRMKDGFKGRLGIEMTAVAYPYGAFSALSNSILQELGYKAAFICTEGINYIDRDSDLFMLKRYNRPSGISSEEFFRRMR